LPNLALAFAEMVPAKIAKSPSQGGREVNVPYSR
jgi:hypothetical protein